MVLPNLRRLLLFVLDSACIAAGIAGAFFLRFEFRLDAGAIFQLWSSLPVALFGYLLSFRYFRLYGGIWRYSSFGDLLRIMQGMAVGFVVFSTSALFIYQGSFPRSVLLMSAVLTFLGVCLVRFMIRLGKEHLGRQAAGLVGIPARAVFIVGAGDLGESVLRQLSRSPGLGLRVAGFIDDDAAKEGKYIHDVPILGGIKDIPQLARRERVEEVIIAIQARRGEVVRAVADGLLRAGLKAELKVAPSLEETLQAPAGDMPVRRVHPADLLSRSVAKLDEPLIARFLAGKRILVTGAGGTIGFELCRQALRYGPSKLILLDNHATSLFYAERELRARVKSTELVQVLGNTLDGGLVENVLGRHSPQVVLHAAAHKHLPQLEYNVQEGIKNNVLATHGLVEAAQRYGCECFLLVSTDKAVRPSSVMGASKRAAEMVVQDFAQRSKGRFLAVRFGNVLGSSGSVLKIFQEQIERGGPITLTHPDMTRYFMTVEEAAQLILQACAMAGGGEIFMLRMGEPVRILDLARNLILLNGRVPDNDIQIQYIGVRPGEKLHEELAEDPDGVEQSAHPEILRVKDIHLQMGPKSLAHYLKTLEICCRNGGGDGALDVLREMVPSFQAPPESEWGRGKTGLT